MRSRAVLLAKLTILVMLVSLVSTAMATAPSSATDAAPESADNSLLLLLDASGSMRESAGGGQTRIAAAKKALNGLVGDLPETSNVGLRVYGATKDSGCDDTKLIAPVAPLDRAGLRKSIAGFSPRGDTPIGESLKAAAADLKDAPGRKTVVLVSDGEDNCAPPQPCDVARDLAKQGLDLRVEAIGFQVGPEARKQLACIAKATGGSYSDAPDARSLSGQLQQLSVRAFRGFEPIGTPITGTADTASAPEMTPGAWVDELAPGEGRNYKVELTEGAIPVVNGALIAGATQPQLDFAESFVVLLKDDEGHECGRGSVSQTSATFTASATMVGKRTSGDGPDACAQPGPHIVTVQRLSDRGEGVNTVEILFSEIGAPDPSAERAAPVEAGPAGGSKKDPTPVRGGTSYGDAPTLGAGSWTDTLRASETLYFRVPVGWGQALSVDVTFDLITPDESIMAVMEVHDALRVDPHNRKLQQISGSNARKPLTIDTPAVAGPTQDTDPVAPFRIAGEQYLVFNGAKYLGDSTAAVVRMRIDLTLDGEQVEGPRLAVVGADTSTPPSAEESTPSATPDEKAEPAAEDESGGVPIWLLVLGLVVLAAVVGGLALAARRRSSKA